MPVGRTRPRPELRWPMTHTKTLLTAAAASAAALAGAAPATAAPAYCGPDSVEQTIGSNASMERETLSRLNAIRRRSGLPALRANAQLRSAAMAHARDMLRRQYFAHFGPTGDS